MDGEAPITKRLILSGLTPAITVADITRRLSSFGSVIAADGFGLLDGLGQPRKFGFVTLETTPSKLGKCMSVLSGAVWKGTKLRLGEARPDFKERILRENQDASDEPPKKKRRYGAVHSEDMSLVTPDNVTQRSGWHISPLGRITYPLIMRPTHPLMPKQEEMARTKLTKGSKRIKNSDTHARRRKIDMIKWGSTHLKGIFLDLEVPFSKNEPMVEDELKKNLGEDDPKESCGHAVHAAAGPANAGLILTSNLHSSPDPCQEIDMHREKAHNLDLIASLFSGNDRVDDDWIGQESVGSDIDVGELVKGDNMLGREEVPRTQGGTPLSEEFRPSLHIEENDGILENDDAGPNAAIPAKNPNVKSSLKDLFAPRDKATFSLIDHLDLDIELNDDLEFLNNQTLPVEPIVPQESSLVSYIQSRTSQPRVALDPKQALFFPLSSDSLGSIKARPRDLYDVAKENGWYWRDNAVRFWNVESEEEIRKKWEESKWELTRDWKKRWKEAEKFRKRKKLVDEGDQRRLY